MDVYLCDRVRELRKKLGLPQGLFARKCKVGREQLSRIECGYIPGLPVLQRIAAGIGVEVSKLIDGVRLESPPRKRRKAASHAA